MKQASGISVYCRHDEIGQIKKLRPNPDNPNMHDDEQIARLVVVIKANGWRMPITVSTRSGMITKGHGRLMAAQRAGWDEAPVEYQRYKTEADEWADVIADNSLPELAITDDKLLADALKRISESSYEFKATGYEEKEWQALMARLEGNPATAKGRTINPEPPDATGRKTIILHYTPEEHEEFEKLASVQMKRIDLLTVSDTILRTVENAASGDIVNSRHSGNQKTVEQK